MPKTQIKYITKPSDEVLDFIKKVNPSIDIDDEYENIKLFLKDSSNFGLFALIYTNVASIFFLNNDEIKHTLKLEKIYYESVNNIDYIIDFLVRKFPYHTLVIETKNYTNSLISYLKKYRIKIENGYLYIKLGQIW